MAGSFTVEIACPNHEVETIVNAIYEGAHTGQRGDGKIFMLWVAIG
jgi:nitrogen regulatory protein PII